LGEMVRSNKHG